MGAPDGASHGRPGLLEGKNAFDVIAADLLPRDRVNDGGLNSKEWQRGTTWLGRGNTAQGGDDVGARLRLPICLLQS